jgi:hypothetical protein
LYVVTAKWAPRFNEAEMEWIERLEAILTEEQRKQAWPPGGKLLDFKMEQARKRWEE